MMYVTYCLINYCHVTKMGMISEAPYCPYKQSLIVKDKYNFKQVKFEYRTITVSLFVEFMSFRSISYHNNYVH